MFRKVIKHHILFLIEVICNNSLRDILVTNTDVENMTIPHCHTKKEDETIQQEETTQL